MSTHLILHDYTLCGKHIDDLRSQDAVYVIQSSFEKEYEIIAQFKTQQDSCRFCMAELLQEEQLIMQKHIILNEEIDDPLI